MADVVAAPPRGLDLYAAPGDRRPLPVTGPRAGALGRLGIHSIQDLLLHFPRYHVDRTTLRTVRDISAAVRAGDEREVQLLAKVIRIERPIRTKTRKTIIRGRIGDETGSIAVMWFNQEWIARALKPGTEAFFYGKVTQWKGHAQLNAPRFEAVRTGREPFNVGRIIPIYPASADVTSDALRRVMWDALARIDQIADPVPDALRRRLGLMTRDAAMRIIHFPDAKEDVLQARRRIVFDELLTLQLGLVYRKRLLERTVRGIPHGAPAPDSLAEQFVAALPFELTAAQRRACDEVASDMARGFPMHRLLEGEVGSGKTVVALYACLLAVEGGYQAAFMAPTEVLAEQHALTVASLLDRAFGAAEGKNLFAAMSRRPSVRLLTGSTPAAARASTLAEVASGEADILIGTHALIQDAVTFKSLGAAVVDEQHRFGVHQRRRLRAKGQVGEPDILVMTATPIPRTLAVTVYGDLDISILDELPRGRRPVETRVAIGDAGRADAYDLVRAEVRVGRQAYIVYALREESESLDLRSAKSEAKRLAAEVFPDLRVGLVTGDMKPDDKEAAMSAFRSGDVDVLVATTVIEVGVDVPNATVMVIENAERFGLAQLHQLRGRVGRGAHVSTCVLLTDTPQDDEARIAAERLRVVEGSNDGFALALADLEQRGEGQLFGARQSGMPQLKMARVLQHQAEIKLAREVAGEILEADPELEEWENRPLAREMRARFPEGSLDVVGSG